ncbi:MAG: polysaccharide deacetylase family protein [Leptospiraceae bacterium]|nr:polysaccharide deacetylase family protein [Leptospiraceae bacterium]MCB1314867.1 polysaccharide deacetylase family protein [Leptospiraceae bacterium]
MNERKFIYSSVAFLACLLLYWLVPAAADAWKATQMEAAGESPPRYNLVPILCFHNIDGAGPYSVSRQEFRHYMEEIRRAKIDVIPLRVLLANARANRLFERPSLVITIDDDYKNIVRVAAPILREYRYPATLFFYINDILPNPRYGTSWEDLRRLKAEGFDIQNHSYTHTMFHHPRDGESPENYANRVQREIITSRDILEENIPGLDIYAFAYPMGYYNDRLREKLVRASYDVLLTTDAEPVDITDEFEGTFHRYTIQKYYVRNPEAMFQRQLEYATRPFIPEKIASSSIDTSTQPDE